MRSLLASLPASIKSFSCRSLQLNPTAWRGSVIIPLHLATLFSLPSARDEPQKPRHEAAPCCEPGYFLPARAAPCRLPTGACWTRWVLIRRQLAAAMDPPTIGLFLPLSCDLFIFFSLLSPLFPCSGTTEEEEVAVEEVVGEEVVVEEWIVI